MIAAAIAGAVPPPAVAPVPRAAVRQAKPSTPASDRQAPKTADAVADAYFEFMLGCRLEDEGDVDAARAAFDRAMKQDPSSADIPAELAALEVRRGRTREAIEFAQAALRIRPTHSEAHRVLGTLYASLAEREEKPAAGSGGSTNRQLAIDHLEKSLKEARPDVAAGVRLGLARLYMQGAATDKAIAVLRQLLADEPWMPQGVALLAQAYTDAGRHADAVALLESAAEVEPSFYETLASAYEDEKRWRDAASAYAKASALNPNDTDLKTRWAFALLSSEDKSAAGKARDVLLEVTKAEPAAGWPLYLLARAQRALGDLDASEASARRLMAVSPASTSGAHALAQVLEARRQWSAIIEALEPVVAKRQGGRASDTALLLTHLGFAYLETGRSADAVNAFERASKLEPSERSYRVYLSQALVSAKQYDRALALARSERTAGATDTRLWRIEADALRGLGRFDEGAALLKSSAGAPARDAAAIQSLAEYYAAAHRYAEAAAILKPAVAQFPEDMNVLFQYGAMLERQSQRAQAEQVFRQLLAKDPEHAPALNYLGYTMVERGGRLGEGVELIKRAVALDPHNGAFLDSLGWGYFKLNQLDLAEPNLRTAAAQLPTDSVVQDHWGDFLAKKGRYADAVEAWRRALAGDGEQIERPQIERKIRDALNKLARDRP